MKTKFTLQLIGLLLLILLFVTQSFTLRAQNKIFYIHDRDSKIQRANLNGSNLEDIVVSRLDGPTDIEVDSENNQLFWSETGKVLKYDPNNDQIDVLVEYQSEGAFTTNITAISLDMSAGKIYWINGGDRRIERSDLDGYNFEIVYSGSEMSNSLSMEVDPNNQKIYWSTLGGSIRSMDYDGTGIESIVTDDIYQPSGLIMDSVNDKLYWTDLVGNEVKRSNLDGSGIEEVISTDLENPEDLVFNEDMSKLYILDKGEFGDGGKLLQVNINGTEIGEIISDLGDPAALAFDKSNNTLVWLDEERPATMVKAGVEGSDLDTLLTELSVFEKLRINGPEKKIFWISSGDIFSADLNGTDTEMLVETNTTAQDIAIDPVSGEIYWSEFSAIRKANIDGTEIQDLITTSADEADYLTLDTNAGKIYWIDGGFNSDRIKRANLDGSNIEDLVTNLDQPLDLRVNQNTGKIYWREGGSFSTLLKRANKDGSGIETIAEDGSAIHSYYVSENQNLLFRSTSDIFSSATDGSNEELIIDNNRSLYGLTVDPGSELIYWFVNDQDENVIWRSDFDGTNAASIISGLPSHYERKLVLYGDGITSNKQKQLKDLNYTIRTYPNPIRDQGIIEFTADKKNLVTISLHDISGKEILLLVNKIMEKGTHSLVMDRNDLEEGIYFLRMISEGTIKTSKIIVLN
jgi:sugar lactone lactonase YvrE